MREKIEYSSKGVSLTTACNLGPEENENSFTCCNCSAPPCTPAPLSNTACSEGERGSRRGRQLKQRASSEPPPTLSSRSYPAPRGKRRVADYEKEFTFRPKLTLTSIRMVARTGHDNVPLLRRLYRGEKKPPNAGSLHNNGFTFAPKLNRLSLQLAKQREARLPEIQAHLSQLACKRETEAKADYTFHPRVSVNSKRLAERVEMDFLTRQQHYLIQRQRITEQNTSLQKQKRSQSHPLSLTSSPSTPPQPHTPHSPRLTPHHRTPPRTHPPPPKISLSLHHRSSTTSSSSSSSSPTPLPSPSKSPPKLISSRPRERSYSACSSSPPHPPPPPPSFHSYESRRRRRRRRQNLTHSHSLPAGGVVTGCLVSEEEATPTTTSEILALQGVWGGLREIERVRRLRTVVERVIKEKKVFICRGGYDTIRQSLRRRGWVERDYTCTELTTPGDVAKIYGGARGARTGSGCGRSCNPPGHAHPKTESDYEDDRGGGGGEEEEVHQMLSRSVRNAVPNFVWSLQRDDIFYGSLDRSTIVNHFSKASSFTTKVGLCTNLRNLVWYGSTDPHLFFPRCYLLSSDEERDSFISDYQLTAALNILKIAIEQHHNPSSPRNLSRNSPLPQPPSHPLSQNSPRGGPPPPPECEVVGEDVVMMALRRCEEEIKSREHRDIEEKCSPKLTNEEWKYLIQNYYHLVLDKAHMVCSGELVQQASCMLKELEKYCPQMQMDGTHNIWIVKPGAMSRGRGIVCMNHLEPILALVSSPVQKKEGKWVVQKYIERPLLIHGTKFDIRQWFLIEEWNPLTLWMYKDCYLRFATQKFTLDDMNESIHLCNNSVQKNYLNSSSRSDLLPEENMWHCCRFQEHLRSLGHTHKWEKLIYPGMKRAIISALQVTQDLVECRKNSFELYGADFMLTEDLRPWLIEINCSPTMKASTSVTKQLCHNVLEDTIKVILDRRRDKDCGTGNFEMVYKQPKIDAPAYVGVQLCVEGVAIQSHTHHRSRSLPVTACTLCLSNTS